MSKMCNQKKNTQPFPLQGHKGIFPPAYHFIMATCMTHFPSAKDKLGMQASALSLTQRLEEWHLTQTHEPLKHTC